MYIYSLYKYTIAGVWPRRPSWSTRRKHQVPQGNNQIQFACVRVCCCCCCCVAFSCGALIVPCLRVSRSVIHTYIGVNPNPTYIYIIGACVAPGIQVKNK